MRILSIGNFGRGWDSSICDEEHIAGALEELGHEVYRWQREEATVGGADKANAYGGAYDMILIAQWDQYPDGLFEVLYDVHKEVRPFVYWAFDYQADGQPWHEKLIKESSLYLSKRIADSKYPNWQWLSQDFAPKFLDKSNLVVEKDIDVLFTGSYLPWATERNETLKAVDEKFNLVIHSVNEWPGFKDQREPVMDGGLPDLYARAKVILSIDHTLEAGYWSDRNAQIMACGRRPLFQYVPLSEATFRDHVDYFYSLKDCLAKVEMRLNSDPEVNHQEVYEEQSYRYAKRNLMVHDRVWDLLTIVGSIL